MENTARLITFTGRVQGVGFRYTTRRIANRCGLTGYVKNLPTGQVEMLAQGTPEDIDACLWSIADTFKSMIIETKKQHAPVNPNYKSFEIAF